MRPTLLLTRPDAASRCFANRLDPALRNSIDVVISPLIQIVQKQADVELSRYRGVIFTSANGVNAMSNALGHADVPAYCVGEATAQTAAKAGWQAIQTGQDAADLVAWLIKVAPDAPLLHVRGTHARGDVAKRLKAAHVPTDETVMYDQLEQGLSPQASIALTAGGPVIAPVFSPRTARILAKTAPPGQAICAAFSPAVAKELLPRPQWHVHIADAPKIEIMALLVEKLVQKVLPG